VKSILRMALAFSVSLFALVSCAKPLPFFGDVPEFRLTDQAGKTVTKADLKGSLWIADFIYTGCSAACPMMTQHLSELGRDLGPEVRLVSFTVDPETDTPERLKEYSEGFGARPEVWSFLTGPVGDIRRTVSEGFKLSLQKTSETDIFHSEKFVLVDRSGHIRGYFDSNPEGIKSLVHAVESLRKERGS
jgi:protein SCO1